MPELWLRYGRSHVVIDIKYENLQAHLFPTAAVSDSNHQRLKDELYNIDIHDDTIVFVLSSSEASLNLIELIAERAILMKHSHIAFGSTTDTLYFLKNSLRRQGLPVYSVTDASFFPLLSKFKNVIFISQVKYDPLFGYSGTPSLLLRKFFPKEMSEAFYNRLNNLPNPYKKLSSLEVALHSVERLKAFSIEIVGSPNFLSLHYGAISHAFESAMGSLDSVNKKAGVDKCQTVLISPSDDLEPHLTLSSSLNCLWNVMDLVKKGGLAVLLSENNMGLGGKALEMLVEDRLDVQKHLEERLPYLEGLEHIVYLKELTKDYELGIISTLPEYYLRRLGLVPFKGTKDYYQQALSRFGRSQKILIVSGADILSVAVLPN
jgi:hypothetical protein